MGETLQKWKAEGHIIHEEAVGYATYGNNSEADRSIMKKLGFDFNRNSCVGFSYGLHPSFSRAVLGGYIPCPDHRIAPDAKFELMQYYCKKMRELKI